MWTWKGFTYPKVRGLSCSDFQADCTLLIPPCHTFPRGNGHEMGISQRKETAKAWQSQRPFLSTKTHKDGVVDKRWWPPDLGQVKTGLKRRRELCLSSQYTRIRRNCQVSDVISFGAIRLYKSCLSLSIFLVPYCFISLLERIIYSYTFMPWIKKAAAYLKPV